MSTKIYLFQTTIIFNLLKLHYLKVSRDYQHSAYLYFEHLTNVSRLFLFLHFLLTPNFCSAFQLENSTPGLATCDKEDPKMTSSLSSMYNSFTNFKYLSTRMQFFTAAGILIVTLQPISNLP